jgi:hypothetical protein
MAESIGMKMAILGAAAGAGYFLFRNQLHHSYPDIFGPGVPGDVIEPTLQSTLIASAKVKGMTAQAIQTALEQFETAKTACTAAGGTWSPTAGSCSSATSTANTVPGTVTTSPDQQTTAQPVKSAPPSTAPTQTPSPAGITARILAAANVTTASLDVWSYYYQAITGSVITPEQMDALISAAGGNRATPVTLASFLAAGQAAGAIPSNLSGIRQARQRTTPARNAWRYA